MYKQRELFDLTDPIINNQKKIEFVDIKQKLLISKVYKVISLFSGCGGMDLGFRGGFEIFGDNYDFNPYDIVFANDIVPNACRTYGYNFNHEAVCADIKSVSLDSLPKADIVIGGFPCQDFSIAGKRKGLASERGRLYLQMKRVIDYCKPIAFIAENVDGIRTSSKGTDTSAIDTILSDFETSGYHVKYCALNAADYGVPQTRIRVIIIGIRNDYNCPIFYPKPIRGDLTDVKWMTSKEAIDDLWDKLDYNSIYNHTSQDYSKARFYPGKKTQGNYCISADKPSNTIRSEHHGNIEGHYNTTNPSEPDNVEFWRRLSVRECARLQSFPDNFIFPCAASEAYKQIGNAVPPVLAWHIARALHITLTKK